MNLSVSLCLYVSVWVLRLCVTFVRPGRTLAKIKDVKMAFVDIVICRLWSTYCAVGGIRRGQAADAAVLLILIDSEVRTQVRVAITRSYAN